MSTAVEQSRSFNQDHRIGENERIQYGYKDAGRSVQFDESGRLLNAPSREIIVVKSPQEDPALRAAIEKARIDTSRMTTVEEKARYLNEFVGNLLKQEDPDKNHVIMDRIARSGSYVGEEISLGQLIDAKTGVCRHRSLLFKVIADEIGVPTAIVRGNYGSGGRSGGHAWNEVSVGNGRTILVDVMHDFVGDMNHPKVRNYADINDNPLYSQYATTSKSASTPDQKYIANDIAQGIGVKPDAVRFHSDGSIGVVVKDTYSRSDLTYDLGMETEPQTLQRRDVPGSRDQVEIVIRKDQLPAHYASIANMPAEPQNVRPQPQGQNIKPKEALDILQNAGWQPVTDRDGNARLYADTSQMTPKQLDDLQKAAKIANLPFEIKESGLGKQVFSVSTNNYYTQTEALEKTTKGILGGLKQSFDNVKGALFAPSPSPAPEPQEIPKAKPFDPSVQTEKQTQIAQDISRRLGTSPDQIRFHRDGSIGVIVDAGYSRSEFANRLDLKVDPGSLSRGAGIDSSTHEIIIAKDQRPARYGFSSDAAPENKTPKASGPAMKPGDVFQTLQTAGWESVTDREGQARLYAETAKMSPYQIAELKEALKTANIPYEIKQSGLRGQVFSVSTADYFNQVPALEAAAKKSGFAGLSDKAEGFLKSIGKKSGIIPAVAIGTVVAGMTFSDGASASDSVKTGAEAVSVTVEVGGKLAEGKKEEAKDAAIIGYSANAASIPAGALALHAARTAGMGVLGMTAATLGGAIVAGILVGSAAEKLIELHNKGNMAHLDGGKLDTAQEVRDMQRTILNDKTHNLPKNITINGEEMSLEQALQHHPKKVAAELEKTHPQAAQAVAQWQELETWRQKFLTNQIPPGTSVPFIRIDDAKDVRGIQDAMLQNPESALPDKFKIAGKEMSMTQALTDHPEKVIEAMKDSPEALAAIGEWKALEEIRMKYQTGQIEAGVEAKLPQQSGTGYTAKAAAPVA